MNAQRRAVFQQPLAQINRRRGAHVVGVLLERQAEHADFFVLQHPERVGDFFDEAVHLVGVDALDFLEQLEIVADLLGNFDERAQVLRKTTAAETDAGVEEPAADALVQADALGDFLHVRAGGLADVGDGVDVGNFQREKGIRRVLDEFGGVDVGDDDRRVERRVNLLHRGDGPLRADADDHAVGLHQIADGKTFAEKFGIADDVKFHLGRCNSA